MKLLFTEGIGASQTTTNAQDEKIPVYETKTAAENDLANLEVGQIIATKDEGNELSNPVDVVQDGNIHAVTSNAVAKFAFDKSKIRVGEARNGSANNDDWIATFDTPFPDDNYVVIATPTSASGAVNCPTGWYVSNQTSTGFRIFCNGNKPLYVFYYIAIHM